MECFINPQIFAVVADLAATNIDIENKDQLVERFMTLVDPKILAKERGEPPPPPPPQQQNPMMQIQK
jgi:hypothetical protein